MTNIAMENPLFLWRFEYGKIIYFYGPCSMAMLNNQMVIDMYILFSPVQDCSFAGSYVCTFVWNKKKKHSNGWLLVIWSFRCYPCVALTRRLQILIGNSKYFNGQLNFLPNPRPTCIANSVLGGPSAFGGSVIARSWMKWSDGFKS